MKILSVFNKIGLTIDWKVIRYGWIGPGQLLKQITIEDINTFATEKIHETDNNMLISELATLKDEFEIDEILKKIAPEIDEHTKRKWHIVLINVILENIHNMNGSYRDKAEEIFTYWYYSDYKAEMPIIEYKGKMLCSPLDFYSSELFGKLLTEHRNLIDDQITKYV